MFKSMSIKDQINVYEKKPNNTEIFCLKENNCCLTNDDCKYVFFTGGCNTLEYVSKIEEEAKKTGRKIGEALPRENITCTCEQNICITHN